MRVLKTCLATAIFLLTFPGCGRAAAPSDLRVPPGFQIGIFAENVPGARSLTLSPRGTVFVGTRNEGKVYALEDRDGNGKAELQFTIASGLNLPNGVAFGDGALFVAESHRILRYDKIEDQLRTPPTPAVIRGEFPDRGIHRWKYLAIGPDGKLYLGIGSLCNNCLGSEPQLASISRFNTDGSGFEVFASGVRNSVGFAWHPQSRELWFTDNGRDEMGDELPPDELNRAARSGLDFGYPYCHGGDIPDPKFGTQRPCREFEAPAAKLGPHVAALGMRFYGGRMFPEEYRGQIFVAEHGSWNRSKKIGYRVSLIKLQGNRVVDYRPFAEGWLNANGEVSGRPVDVLVMPDGALLVSDDRGGKIYRISVLKSAVSPS